MKSNPEELRLLLDDMVNRPGNHCGPNRAELLELVRREHSRRLRVRTACSLAAAVSVAAMVLAWPRGEKAGQTAAVTPRPTPEIVINHVDDQQLLVLLKDTPVALMEWPNGERTVLVVEYPGP
jgi:hypothetical protein